MAKEKLMATSVSPDTETRLMQRITINPDVLAGKPTIRGMRISVEQIIKLLSLGMSSEEIIEEFPVLDEDDIRAAFAYAHSALSDEDFYDTAIANSRKDEARETLEQVKKNVFGGS